MTEATERVAQTLDALARDLEVAAAHARAAAGHFRDEEIPRAAAHEFAVFGHVIRAQRALEELAMEHASRSTPRAAPEA